MKLYHTSKLENKETIESEGIYPSMSRKLTLADENLQDLEGVYFFTDIDSAESFGIDQNDEFIIFKVECSGDKVIIDPEYDGEAVFIETDEPIMIDGIALINEW
jgi:hypothetical protein